METISRFGLQSHSRLIHALVLLALSLPYFINLGESSLWDANEAFYAETPREMLVTGDYLAPYFNYQPRVQKPPLTYWAILLSYKFFGVHEFSVRFPGALAALGVLLFSYGMARLLFNPRSALMAAAISGTTARIFILERRLPIDILLLFFLTGTLFFLIRSLQKRSTGSWMMAYVFISLGFLTKGPIAIIIPVVTLWIWMLWCRKTKFLEIHPILGLIVFACIALPWYLLIYKAHGWKYIAPFFLSDNLGRFASETLGPSRGLFYYISIYASDFFPWSLLGLAALIWLWRNRRIEHPLKSLSFGLPLIWCGLTFLLFSLSKNKQEYYIAPIYPVAAVFIAGVLDKNIFGRISAKFRRDKPASEQENTSRASQQNHRSTISLWIWSYGVLAFLLFAASLLLPYILGSFMPGLPFLLHYIPSIVFTAGSAWITWGIVRKTFLPCFASLAFSLWTIFLLGASVYVPALEIVRPVKRFCQFIDAHWCAADGDEAGFFRASLPSMVFYLKHPIFQETSYEQMIQRFQSERRVFCILSQSDYAYFMKQNLQLHILDQHSHFSIQIGSLLKNGNYPGKELLLVSNQSYSTIPCRKGRE
jgi:4-amino-4-deoxy-L-arabinose transferase-like glycosyltransferase